MKYGRYEIKSKLGKGSMGVVYLAHDPSIDRQVALKVLHKEHVSSKGITERFFKEAKAIGRLSHPNIVSVYDVGQDHGTIYIAMEYLEGTSLDQLIKSQTMDLPAIAKIGTQVATALSYAHQKGIVHRDIKPSNLIISDNHQVKLTDFGIARFDDATITLQTRAGDILGTPAYMSPEQIAGQNVDKRSDLYSLGVILYELLVGQRPFSGTTMVSLFRAISDQHPLPPKKVNPSVSRNLSALILKCLEKEPDRRYQSGADLASDLNAYLGHQPTGLKRWNTAKHYQRALWAAIAMVAVIICWQAYDYLIANRTVTAQVNISSEPSNASIYLNSDFKGRTPMRYELPLGTYNVRLTLAEHYESEAKIEIQEQGDIPVHLRLLPIEPATANGSRP